MKNILFLSILLLFGILNNCDGRDFRNEDRRNYVETNKLSPVILIPGDGGSQVEASLNKPATVHYYCEKSADFFNIWLNPKLLVPLVIQCWIDNVKLNYDNVTRTTSNMPGVTIRIPGFGRSEVVEWLDPSFTQSLAGAYFKDVANALVARGYQRNVTIRGAPYDFRKAPNENKQWFLDMKTLVEETYENADKQPVTFIVHSMGGPMSLVFLQQQAQSWKDKYIARIISLAGAWAGSAKAVKVFAIGDDLGSYALSGSVMRAEQITSPSLAWLLPSPHFWKENEVLVSTPHKQYTMANLDEFFTDINYTTGWEMRKDTLKYTDFTAPGVEVHCLYGEGYPTMERLNYKDDLSGTPSLVTGDGDGTVNSRSLRSCEKWAGTKNQNDKKIFSIELPRADHMGILSDKRSIEYVLKLLVGSSEYDIDESNKYDYGHYGKHVSEIIDVPGCGGNRLQASLNKPSAVHWFCYSTSGVFDLWLDPTQMIPELIDCWVDNIKLTYDNVTRKTSNSPGVTITVPGWQHTEVMEWIDTTYIVQNYDYGAYYTFIVKALLNVGYQRDINLFGAPYDFRKGPNENKKWFARLKILVRYIYDLNDQTPITFIAHSMGGKMLLIFLQQMPQTWKDKYISKVITLNTPWGGSVQSIQAMSVGYTFGSTVLAVDSMMQVQRSSPSVIWLMPSEHFWKQNEVLVMTTKKNYTLANINEFFEDLGAPNAWEMTKDLAAYNDFTAPGVEISCVYGSNVASTERIDFGYGLNNTNPSYVTGDGDGTVTTRSLAGCKHWDGTASQLNRTVNTIVLPGAEHYDILADHRAINHILNTLTGLSNYPKVSRRNIAKIRFF